jgi:hypothetical protein
MEKPRLSQVVESKLQKCKHYSKLFVYKGLQIMFHYMSI